MLHFVYDFLGMLLVPLSFLPSSVQSYLQIITSTFALFFIGKFFKWIWDILPVA